MDRILPSNIEAFSKAIRAKLTDKDFAKRYLLQKKCLFSFLFGAPDTIRTCDFYLRRVALYPAELRALGSNITANAVVT